MATEVKLPKLGQTMEEGTIVKCLVKGGDKVGRGDTLFEIETDKATLEMESPDQGYVKAVLVEPGQTVAIHETILILGAENEQVPQELIASAKERIKGRNNRPTVEVIAESEISEEQAAVETAEAVSQMQEPGRYQPGGKFTLNRLQKITAERMLQSKRQIPCFYLTARADMTEVSAYRDRINTESDVKVSYNDFIIKAVAIGLERFGLMTGRLEGETIIQAESIDIGLAVSVPGGVVAPVVKDADKKDVRQIAADTQALTQRARNNRLSPEDLSGACITVSNLGSFGIEWFIPIVIPGQCSIVGIGAITDTPVLEPGAEGINTADTGTFSAARGQVRKLMNMTLSVDHRTANGAYAGQFLDYVRKVLEDVSNFEPGAGR